MSIGARYIEPEIPDELDATYRRTFMRLKGLFCARGCTPEEAADLAQEAAMRAYMHVRRWGVSGEGLDPLINRIARNLLIDRHRRVAPRLVPLDNCEDFGDPSADPTEEVIRRQRSTEVQSAVGELPARHQTAILYSMGGMSPAEVGDRLGIGRNAADALLHRARRSLRERLRHVGEGAFSFGLFIRLRAREAGRKMGLINSLDGAAAVGVPATVAAFAVAIAAITFAGGGAGSAGSAPRFASQMASHTRHVASGAGGGAGSIGAPNSSSAGGSGSSGVTWGVNTGHGKYGFKAKANGSDGTPLLGVGPNLSEYDNGKTSDTTRAAQNAVRHTCMQHRAACDAIAEQSK